MATEQEGVSTWEIEERLVGCIYKCVHEYLCCVSGEVEHFT